MSLTRRALRLYGYLPSRVHRGIARTIRPRYTVGTAPFVILDDDRVLLVRQSYARLWATPGGFLGRGEEAHAGAVREVREETGLDVVVVAGPAAVVDPRRRSVEVAFRMRCLDDPASAAPCSPEIEEVRWFPLDDLPEMQRDIAAAWEALQLFERR